MSSSDESEGSSSDGDSESEESEDEDEDDNSSEMKGDDKETAKAAREIKPLPKRKKDEEPIIIEL